MMMTFSPGSPQVCSTRPECDALFESLKVEMKAKSALQRAKQLGAKPGLSRPAPRPQTPSPRELYEQRKAEFFAKQNGSPPVPPQKKAMTLSPSALYEQRKAEFHALQDRRP